MNQRTHGDLHSDDGVVGTAAPLLIDTPETRRALQRLVAGLTPQRFWHEDLVQEALLHWWQVEPRRPGQHRAWYLRNCEFHLRNRLRHGRSIDSPKRRNGASPPKGAEDDLDVRDVTSEFEGVVAQDLKGVLLDWLTPVECQILACLEDGLSVRETARRLGISHTCVLKNRRKIAALVMRLEPDLRLNAPPGRRRT